MNTRDIRPRKGNLFGMGGRIFNIKLTNLLA
jgi:hypothetical protein